MDSGAIVPVIEIEEASRNLSPRPQPKTPSISESFFPDNAESIVESSRPPTRVLSQNVKKKIKQRKDDKHDARVSQLLERNAIWYRRQSYCECFTMITILVGFTCFSLYVVFAYGFNKKNVFKLLHESPRKMVRNQDDSVDLLCQADSYWEFCRWIHSDRFCDYEWLSVSRGAQEIGCDFPENKVEFIGDYNSFECGIRVHNLGIKDRGVWQCEVEKYYFGFSRRYGELETSTISLSVKEKIGQTSSLVPTVSTETPLASGQTPNVYNTTLNPLTELHEYQRQFFYLKIFVLGGVGSIFASLIGTFWAYFIYMWRLWDVGKREPIITSSKIPKTFDLPREDAFSSEKQKSISEDQISIQSCRRSISFAVCTLDEETMSFNIERKSILLGDSAKQFSSQMFANPSPLFEHMATKFKEVTGLGPKCRIRSGSKFSETNLGGDTIEIYCEQGHSRGSQRGESPKVEETTL